MFNLRNVNRAGRRSANKILVLVNVLLFVFGFIALCVGWKKTCHHPYNIWLVVANARIGIDLYWTYHLVRLNDTHQDPSEVERWREALGIFSFIWLILGTSWSTNAGNCASWNNIIFIASVSIIIWSYFIMLLPIIVAVVAFPFFLLFLPCYLRRLRNRDENRNVELTFTDLTSLAFNPQPVPDNVIQSWPLVPFDDSISETTCAICLVDFEEGEEVKILPCDGKHPFHQACITEWLHVKDTCPCCRQNLRNSLT